MMNYIKKGRAIKRESHVHVDMGISKNLVTTNPIEMA